jgi:PHD/YefM family antitoxin component YafN of YafNO toxin-antitoxin module
MARTVNVIPSREARQHLGTMLQRFRQGEHEPMIFGAHRKPEAVILPFEEYERLLDIEERWAGEEAFLSEVRRRIARADENPDSTISMSLEDLVAGLGPAAEQMLREIKAEKADDQPRVAHG